MSARRAAISLLERGQALEHVVVAAEIGGEHAHDGLVLDPRERGRLLQPLPERGQPLLRQLVLGALGRPARLLARAEVAEPLEPLRLRVPVALGGGPVEPALRAHHPDEIVRAGAAPSDEDEHDVRERSELGA